MEFHVAVHVSDVFMTVLSEGPSTWQIAFKVPKVVTKFPIPDCGSRNR